MLNFKHVSKANGTVPTPKFKHKFAFGLAGVIVSVGLYVLQNGHLPDGRTDFHEL